MSQGVLYCKVNPTKLHTRIIYSMFFFTYSLNVSMFNLSILHIQLTRLNIETTYPGCVLGLSPYGSWDKLQRPRDPVKDRWKRMDG